MSCCKPCYNPCELALLFLASQQNRQQPRPPTGNLTVEIRVGNTPSQNNPVTPALNFTLTGPVNGIVNNNTISLTGVISDSSGSVATANVTVSGSTSTTVTVTLLITYPFSPGSSTTLTLSNFNITNIPGTNTTTFNNQAFTITNGANTLTLAADVVVTLVIN